MKQLTIGISAATNQLQWLDELFENLSKISMHADFVLDVYDNASQEISQAYRDKIYTVTKLGFPLQNIRFRKMGMLGESRHWIINNAATPYVMFMDGDDYIYTDKVKYILDLMPSANTEMVLFSGEGWHNGTVVPWLRENLPHAATLNRSQILAWFREHGWRFTSACVKMYNVKWLKEKGISFPQSLFYEDTPAWFQIVHHLQSMTVLPLCVYGYRRWSEGQITNNRSWRMFDLFWILEGMKKDLKKLNASHSIWVGYWKFAFDHMLWSVYNFRNNKLSQKDNILFGMLSRKVALESRQQLESAGECHFTNAQVSVASFARPRFRVKRILQRLYRRFHNLILSGYDYE